MSYDFANPKDRRELDALSLVALYGELGGDPRITAEWDTPTLLHWQPGEERPALADEDPAVQQAIGRCATTRVWRSLPEGSRSMVDLSGVHPAECGWCDMPLEELLKVCDWATFEGRTQTAEWHTWTQDRDGHRQSYQRRVPLDSRNRRHADFWALSRDHREALVQRAQYGAVPA